MTQSKRATLLLSVQRALTGIITPHMRGVICSLVNDQITLYFIFDGAPAEEDVERCSLAGTEVAADFAREPLDFEIIIRPVPEPMDDLASGDWVYRRHEQQIAQDIARINLGSEEAVILFDLLSRWSTSKPSRTPGSACYESTAECAVLNNILCDLEKQLVAPLKPDYDLILARARKALAHQWDHPTLSG
jgi:hypothetical protein